MTTMLAIRFIDKCRKGKHKCHTSIKHSRKGHTRKAQMPYRHKIFQKRAHKPSEQKSVFERLHANSKTLARAQTNVSARCKVTRGTTEDWHKADGVIRPCFDQKHKNSIMVMRPLHGLICTRCPSLDIVYTQIKKQCVARCEGLCERCYPHRCGSYNRLKNMHN